MKTKIFGICIYTSTILFFGFVSLYAYAWIVNSNPWKSYITTGNSNPVTVIDPDSPSKKAYTFHPYVIRIAVEKSDVEEMQGRHLLFFNQDMPYELNASFAFADGDKRIGKSGFMGYGIQFGSWTHSARMLGCSDNDRTSQTVFLGYGIYFSDIDHTVNKEQNWWTFFINLWYPIIIFGILPAIFVVKKLRNRKSTSTKKTTS